MALPRGRPFPKGVSGNPLGKPKMAVELQKIRALNQTTFTATVNKFLSMTKDEVKAASKDPSTPVLELMVASVMSKAIEAGDQQRLNFLLDRIVGKVPDKVSLNVSHLSDQELHEQLNDAIKLIGGPNGSETNSPETQGSETK